MWLSHALRSCGRLPSAASQPTAVLAALCPLRRSCLSPTRALTATCPEPVRSIASSASAALRCAVQRRPLTTAPGKVEVQQRPLTVEVQQRPLTTAPEKVDITFEFADGERQQLRVNSGDNLLDVVLDHNVDIDGFGACEGTLACSTCHLVLPQDVYDRVKDEVSDEEMDMLDLAYGVQDTSRLGCQCIVTKEYQDKVIKVPESVNDQR